MPPICRSFAHVENETIIVFSLSQLWNPDLSIDIMDIAFFLILISIMLYAARTIGALPALFLNN